MKKSSIIHHDLLSVVEEMPDEVAGKFVKQLSRLMNGEPYATTDFSLKMALHPFISQFKRDNEKYKNICERNKTNGLLGGRPKNPKNPDGSTKTQANPNNHDNDKDNDKDNGSDKKKKTNCPKEFPITDQMVDYASSKKYHKSLIDLTEGFLLYHKAKGSKMSCWYSAWQTWLRNDIKFNGAGSTSEFV